MNNDELAKRRKRHLHCKETQRLMAFPPSVVRLFTTPTTMMNSQKVLNAVCTAHKYKYNEYLSTVGGEVFYDIDHNDSRK